MTVLLLVAVGGALLHGITNRATRTPDEQCTPRRWQNWHAFLAGIAAGLAALALYVLAVVTAGITAPYWAVLVTADVLTIGWKLAKHHHRLRERRHLEALFAKPSAGENA
jgi:hypothetical protein